MLKSNKNLLTVKTTLNDWFSFYFEKAKDCLWPSMTAQVSFRFFDFETIASQIHKRFVLQIVYRTTKIMHSFIMVKMRQVSFASRKDKIMPQGENSGSLKLTVTTKGRRNWGCVHPQSSFRRPGIELCTPRFSYLPPPLPQELFWSVMLYHLVTHSVFDDKKWVKLVSI